MNNRVYPEQRHRILRTPPRFLSALQLLLLRADTQLQGEYKTLWAQALNTEAACSTSAS